MDEEKKLDLSGLARDMLLWEQLRGQLEEIENRIRTAVLALGKTQTVGTVRATYSNGRKTYDYEAAGRTAAPDIIADYTKEEVVIKTDWRRVCDVALIEDIPFTQSPPSVSVKIIA